MLLDILYFGFTTYSEWFGQVVAKKTKEKPILMTFCGHSTKKKNDSLFVFSSIHILGLYWSF